MKVYELAKDLSLTSKELLEKLKGLGIKAKSHLSAIDSAEVKKITKELKTAKTAPKSKGTKKAVKKKDSVEKNTKTSTAKKATQKKTTPSKKPATGKTEVSKPSKPAVKASKPKPAKIEKKAAEKTPQTKASAEEKEVEIKQQPAPDVTEPAQAAADIVETKPAKPLVCALPTTVKELSLKLSCKVNELIKELMGMGLFVTINQSIGKEVVEKICLKFGYTHQEPPTIEDELLEDHMEGHRAGKDHEHVARAPIITMMGHVDHGKTSLLDHIRKSRVAQKEKGGITQHIGAYQVELSKGRVTFLDTPGHAAFTRMRARGAQVTDIVVLVVAADDGIMPQTKEAIDHARAAGVPIVVAINKCDLPTADINNVYKGLAEYDLLPEEWGGKTVAVKVSAKTGEGIDDLLEMLLLEAELLELKANPHAHARGVVVESRLSKGKGALATVLIRNGTLKQGDIIICDLYWGRIKGMISYNGTPINSAGASTPVEVIGLSGVPEAGEEFFVVRDEKKAKTLGELKLSKKKKEELLARTDKVTLENLFEKISQENIKELKIILKGDVQGSLEAVAGSLEKIPQDKVRINIIHQSVGAITETDVMLAAASNAIIVGFHVKIIPGATDIAEREGVEIKQYNIIYEAVNDLEAALEGLLEPDIKESVVGKVNVRAVFKLSKSSGVIAGSYVTKGKVFRNHKVRVYRDDEFMYEDKIDTLKRFKDDVREVAEGYECGIKLAAHDDIKEGDQIEVIQTEKITRRLRN